MKTFYRGCGENGTLLRRWHVRLFTQPCLTLCDPMGYTVHGILLARIRVGSCSLLQGIFRTQGSNPGLPHCRQTLYHLSHQGSPRILKWVADPFSRGTSPPRSWTRVSCIHCRADSLPSYQGSPGNSQGCPVLLLLFNMGLEILVRSIRQENKILILKLERKK